MPDQDVTPVTPCNPPLNNLAAVRASVESGGLKDYANPKSALTVGASAAMVLAFTSTLCASFNLPAAIVGLLLSLFFATGQVYYIQESVMAKIFYGLILTMLIFHTARGGNSTLSSVGVDKALVPAQSIEVPKTSQYSFDIVSAAYAGGIVATNKHSDEKFYFYKMNENGLPVYTNRLGLIYVDKNYKKSTFAPWSFK